MTLRGAFGTRRLYRAVAGALGAALLVAASVGPGARAAELVMFEARHCTWCATWQSEVGGIYHRTPEARIAPLRRVDLRAPRPADLAGLGQVVYTPTFVLVDQGREIGRIPGYPGVDHFWGLLGVLLQRLDPAPDP